MIVGRNTFLILIVAHTAVDAVALSRGFQVLFVSVARNQNIVNIDHDHRQNLEESFHRLLEHCRGRRYSEWKAVVPV